MPRAKQTAGLGAAQNVPQDVNIFSTLLTTTKGADQTPISGCVPFAGVNAAGLLRNLYA